MQWSSKKIKELFTSPMSVPEYQRSYSWSKDNVDIFFDDLLGGLKRDDDYLFGQVIIHNDNGKLYIVDGQQRLITSTIFLCVVRDIINEEVMLGLDSLNTKLGNALGFEDDGYTLAVGNGDNAFFVNYIQGADHDYTPKTKSNKKIYDAYELLYERVISYLNEHQDRKGSLKELTEYFLNKFSLSYVETSDLSQAFIIFETLNSRGTALELHELLKNHFFSRLDSKHSYVKTEWTKMVDTLSDKCNGKISQYIRYYWNSKNKFLREKEMFVKISSMSDDDAFLFLDGLFKYVEIYVELFNPEQSTIYSIDSKKALINLKEFKAESFYPLIIAMHDSNQIKPDIARVISAVESLVFRNQVIMKKTANRNEVFLSDLAYKLSSGQYSVENVLNYIYDSTVPDLEMESVFKIMAPKQALGKIILINIYDYEHPELKISDDGNKVHLEHIMPLTKGEWDVETNVWREYKDRLGNMTLLYGTINKSIKNKLFEEKKIQYLQSMIEDTVKIAALPCWTEKEIENRQQDLFEKAIKRWPKLRSRPSQPMLDI